jgi:hypothetical protein
MFAEDDNEEKPNYPHLDDTAFTPDEAESIKAYKGTLQSKIAKNQSVLRGLETSFWGITSYSLAKFLVVTSGSVGVGLAVAASVLINNITNRDCLDSINIDINDGVKTEGMGKLVKFGFSTIVSGFVIWSAIGDFYHIKNQSKETYNNLQNTVEEFNRLPDKNQNELLVIGAILGIAGLYVAIDSRGRR